MMEMRPDCEKCGSDLAAHLHGAFVCSFECTFCADCTDQMDEVCPNCGGELADRPIRSKKLQEKYPASTTRKFKG
jgi:uncharacterized protein